jgi:hypothetical protein
MSGRRLEAEVEQEMQGEIFQQAARAAGTKEAE